MPKFRAKPVVIEARHLTDYADQELLDWCHGVLVYDPHSKPDGVRFATLEGTVTATLGDWIICGTQGEFYPCNDAVLREKYDEVAA